MAAYVRLTEACMQVLDVSLRRVYTENHELEGSDTQIGA